MPTFLSMTWLIILKLKSFDIKLFHFIKAMIIFVVLMPFFLKFCISTYFLCIKEKKNKAPYLKTNLFKIQYTYKQDVT